MSPQPRRAHRLPPGCAGDPDRGASAPAQLDPASLRRAAAVVRNGGNVADRGHLHASGLQGADRHLSPGARPFDKNFNGSHPVLHRLAGGAFGGYLCRVWGALAGSFEPAGPGAGPGDDISCLIGEGDDRVVEGRLNIGTTTRNILPVASPYSSSLSRSPTSICHTCCLSTRSRLTQRRAVPARVRRSTATGPASGSRYPASDLCACARWSWFAGHAPAVRAGDEARGSIRYPSGA